METHRGPMKGRAGKGLGSRWRRKTGPLTVALFAVCGLSSGVAQSVPPGGAGQTAPPPVAPVATTLAASQTPANLPVITLDEAIRRAQLNEPTLADARANDIVAKIDSRLARTALLPQAIYHNQYLFTESNGSVNSGGQAGFQPSPVFIANNSVHEYVSQASVTETLAADGFAQIRRADATAAQTAAEFEITRRGLVATVVGQYYGLLAADEKYRVAQRARDEAASFVALTTKLEQGREVAHADVVKADLQLQQRERDGNDAQVLAEKARLDLAVLLFPDPRTQYRLAETTGAPPLLPARADVETAAKRYSPELRSTFAALGVAREEVSIARLAYLPDLSFNYLFGIDAPQFAAHGPTSPETGGGVIRPRNLGYSAFVNLDIPVWNWFATRDRIRQGEARRTAAEVTLNYTQKRLLVQLDELYSEAAIANRQLQSLDESVGTARESLRLTNLRYQAGEGTALEVVDAQNALLLAEDAQADGAVRYESALANLQTLTGTLP